MGKVADYINEIPFDEEYYRIFGKHMSYGKIYCPFHNNTDTPAAKYYSDSNTCYCFVCQRQFGTYDLLRRYNPSRIEDIKGSVLIEDKSAQKQLSKRDLFVNIDRNKEIGEIVKDIIDGVGI